MKIKKFSVKTKRGLVTIEVDTSTGQIIKKTLISHKSVVDQNRTKSNYYQRREREGVYSFFVDWDYCKNHRQSFPKGTKCPKCP